MATQNTSKTEAKTEPKVKKEPVPVAKRISDQLKRAAVNGKITKDELEHIRKLTESLVNFV